MNDLGLKIHNAKSSVKAVKKNVLTFASFCGKFILENPKISSLTVFILFSFVSAFLPHESRVFMIDFLKVILNEK